MATWTKLSSAVQASTGPAPPSQPKPKEAPATQDQAKETTNDADMAHQGGTEQDDADHSSCPEEGLESQWLDYLAQNPELQGLPEDKLKAKQQSWQTITSKSKRFRPF